MKTPSLLLALTTIATIAVAAISATYLHVLPTFFPQWRTPLFMILGTLSAGVAAALRTSAIEPSKLTSALVGLVMAIAVAFASLAIIVNTRGS